MAYKPTFTDYHREPEGHGLSRSSAKNKAIHAKHYGSENQRKIHHGIVKSVLKKEYRGAEHKKINETFK